ncbi:peptide deformylase [Kordiimonas lacus]|uniref:Peptide deformylase-like n=1 Tax=Kordiimonas lacus TaxID=637679 RepID=A0A1G6WQW1_9PROT|nr:peptide deformylase [Kordiimonas lacus]SDD68262.1 peptide deformylase [Kordiimonas lacus]
MAHLHIVAAPNPIFRQKAVPVVDVDDGIKALAEQMLDVMYENRGIGIAANMVGLLHRIIVVDIQPDGNRDPLVCINPEITWASDETSTNEEASLSFPGISADITRPNAIKLTYLDQQGEKQELDAEGFLAIVIQHEMDYLDGRTYLDHLSKMKRDRLLKKMQKYLKQGHACGDPHCGHDHH